jgi:hypothetical protein
MFMERWMVFRVIVQKIDVVVSFMGWVKLDVTDVLQCIVWVCCSGVTDDENVDISGVKSEGFFVRCLMTDFSSVCQRWGNPWLHLFLACKFDPGRKGNFGLGWYPVDQ